jgi:hypothetical protein
MDDPCAPEIVNDAITALLAVVAKSADDLYAFHDVVSKAHLAALPPFPRASLLVTERIVDDLKRVERDLRDVLVALGLVR